MAILVNQSAAPWHLYRLAITFTAVLLAGCATFRPVEYNVAINAFSDTDAPDLRNYFLLPLDRNVDLNDLEFKEYARYVHKALSARGFRRANSFDTADVHIFMSYGIGSPEDHAYSYNVPTWGQTGVSSSHTTASVTSFGNSANVNSTTTYTPTYGITGYETRNGTVTTYTRHLTIGGTDGNLYRQTGQIKEIWRTRIVSVGRSGDLRSVFPMMLAAGYDLIAKNSGQVVQRSLAADAPVAKWMREPPPAPAAPRTPGRGSSPSAVVGSIAPAKQ